MTVKRISKEKQGQVAIMSGSGKSVNQIHLNTGLHSTTITRILQEPDIVDLKERIQERLADKFLALSENILDSVSEEDLLKASLQQKAISAATMLDKARLIKGASTENISIMTKLVYDSPDLPDD